MAFNKQRESFLINTISQRNIRRFSCCIINQFSIAWLFVILMFLTISTIYFISFISQRNSKSNQQTDLHGISTTYIDSATCCVSLNKPEDICGRKNCTATCLEPKFFITDLDNDLKKFNLNQNDKVLAFFIETSGSGTLSFRQACSVESLAFHNKNLKVNVLFTDVKINNSSKTLRKLKDAYSNIKLNSINVNNFMAGTPLENWYHCTNWRKGSFYVNNLSNGLRLLTLSKYGGYYFDLDIISVRPVTYYRNFVAAQEDEYVNNAAIHADFKNPILDLAIEDFVINFRPDVWGNNGPALIFRILKKWCDKKNLKSMDYVSCRGFNVLRTSSFYPVHFSELGKLFDQQTTNDTEAYSISWLKKEVVGVHVWNKLSKGHPVYKNSTQAYARLAQEHCPFIFSIAPEIF